MSKKLRILSRAITHNVEGASTQTGTPTPSDPIDVLPLQTDTITGINISSWNLHGISTYKDIYNYSTKKITRYIKVKVLDGSESWTYDQYGRFAITFGDILTPGATRGANIMSSHFIAKTSASSAGEMFTYSSITYFFPPSGISTVSAWTEWLAAQYADGTPVIVYYPLTSTVTETIEYAPPKCVITTSEDSGKVRELVTRGKNLFRDSKASLTKNISQDGTTYTSTTLSDASNYVVFWLDSTRVSLCSPTIVGTRKKYTFTKTSAFNYISVGWIGSSDSYFKYNISDLQDGNTYTISFEMVTERTSTTNGSFKEVQIEDGDTATSYKEWSTPSSVILSNTAHRLISQEVSE